MMAFGWQLGLWFSLAETDRCWVFDVVVCRAGSSAGSSYVTMLGVAASRKELEPREKGP